MLPATLNEYLEKVAHETAKMSWPGRMSSILHASTKRAVEEHFFATAFVSELQGLWNDPAFRIIARELSAPPRGTRMCGFPGAKTRENSPVSGGGESPDTDRDTFSHGLFRNC